jgi:hypothetical protein
MIVTGRLPAFAAARHHLCTGPNMALEVASFLPLAPGDSSLRGNVGRIKLDQRPLWWGRYAAATGGNAEAMPKALEDDRLTGLSAEPLLCYLLALSGYVADRWEQAADNPNRVYEGLVDSVWKRAWGDGQGAGHRRQGPGRNLSNPAFNRLMDSVALAAWRGGDTRTVEENGFIETLKLLRTEEDWEAFKADSGPDLGNLAMNFYLKSSEADKRGFEFTHKSFGDYLAARSLLDLAETVKDTRHAMTDWLEATGNGELTDEILNFLRNQARIWAETAEGQNRLKTIKAAFQGMASHAMLHGFPAHSNWSGTWRQAEARQNRAEIMIWAILNSCALAIYDHDQEAARVVVDWSDKRALARLLQRMDTDGVGSRCLSLIEADGADLSCMNLGRTDLRFARLGRGNFFNTYFGAASLTGANLRKASLAWASFDVASLRDACLAEARLERCDMRRTTFGNTDFSDAEIDQAGAEAVGLNFAALEVRSSETPDARLIPDGTLVSGRGGEIGQNAKVRRSGPRPGVTRAS